jgi:hypothetical protein
VLRRNLATQPQQRKTRKIKKRKEKKKKKKKKSSRKLKPLQTTCLRHHMIAAVEKTVNPKKANAGKKKKKKKRNGEKNQSKGETIHSSETLTFFNKNSFTQFKVWLFSSPLSLLCWLRIEWQSRAKFLRFLLGWRWRALRDRGVPPAFPTLPSRCLFFLSEQMKPKAFLSSPDPPKICTASRAQNSNVLVA